MPRRWMVVTIVVVIVLLVADVAYASLVNRRAAASFASTQHLQARPYVHINGWPFVIQGLRRSFGYVTVDADPARTTGAASVDVHPLKLSIHGLHAGDGFDRARIDRASGSARIGYRSISHGLGHRIRFAGADRVSATLRIRFEGRSYRPSVSARPDLSDGRLTFRDLATTDERGLPTSALGPLREIFAQPFVLGRFPFGVRPTSVVAGQYGMTFKLSGRDLQLGS